MPIQNDTGIIEPLLRGDIYQVRLDPVLGSEIGKTRPALVIQNNIANRTSPVVVVAAISSLKDITKLMPIMVTLKAGEGGLDVDSFVDCGQIRTISKTHRFLFKRGSLNEEQMYRVKLALRISLSI